MTIELIAIQQDKIQEGQNSYQEWRDTLLATAENREMYVEEAQKKEIWLQLVEARQAAGLTQAQVAERMGVSQAQVARIERRGYDAYTLRTLYRYLSALGHGFALKVGITRPDEAASIRAAS